MKNDVALKILGEKSCEIKGGGQEMAAMMLMLKFFNNGCVVSINIIAAISWPPPFFFHPGFLRPHHFSQLGCFCVDTIYKKKINKQVYKKCEIFN